MTKIYINNNLKIIIMVLLSSLIKLKINKKIKLNNMHLTSGKKNLEHG